MRVGPYDDALDAVSTNPSVDPLDVRSDSIERNDEIAGDLVGASTDTETCYDFLLTGRQAGVQA